MSDEETAPQIPPEALQSQAAFSSWLQSLPPPPQGFAIGDDIDWKAPWLEVILRVELPFWLLVNNTNLETIVEGHNFPVSINGETFELHVGNEIADSKRTVIYSGPIKKLEEIKAARDILAIKPTLPLVWRKCKTILRITTRCNQDVWQKVQTPHLSSIYYYLQTLCNAHIPVINKLIQLYRLATYDQFAFEVSPWDVPYWYIAREHISKCILVPYRGWDHRPLQLADDVGNRQFYQLIDSTALHARMPDTPTPGELELLDAINLMERGSYSDAVRRVTTAIEVVVEWATADLLERKEGKRAAVKFIKETRSNFPQRIKKFDELIGEQTLPGGLARELARTRTLRHKIVHGGYRISSAERGLAQRSIDTGRWIFNRFENNEQKRQVRESKIAYRSLGRDLLYDMFQAKITPDGVTLSSVRDRM